MEKREGSAGYLESWESYWRDVTTARGAAFWDSAPAQGIERELPLFRSLVDPALPLVDVGCGNGTQTRALANAFARVIGVDISAEAIRGAELVHGAANIEYRTLDLLDAEAARALHAEYGDANLYVRAVLHQLRAEHRQQAVENLAALLGARGQAFLVELSPAADHLFASLAERFGAPPPKLQAVFAHGIVPASLNEGDILGRFRAVGFEPHLTSTTTIVTTQPLPTGEVIEVPCDCWLFRRRSDADSRR